MYAGNKIKSVIYFFIKWCENYMYTIVDYKFKIIYCMKISLEKSFYHE